MAALYKVLVGGRACHGGDLLWSLPRANGDDYAAGEWHHVEPPIKVCYRGLHLTSDPSKWLRAGCAVYLAEGRGAADADDDKTAFAEARLLRPAPEMIPSYFTESMAFVREQIPCVPWLHADGEPDPTWRLFTAPTVHAARAAAGDAARDAARAAAWDAAGDAARAAAWAAAMAATWDATWAAALFTEVEHICGDLPIAETHRQHVRDRWRVWQKGYGLLCDVAGVLYCYGIER